MFGINNAIRSVATGTAVSVDSAARTIVGGLSLIEKAVERRLDANYQNSKTVALHLEAIKDLKETAKSCGHQDLAGAIAEMNAIYDLIKK